MADTLRNHFGTQNTVASGEQAMTVANSAGPNTILSFTLCNNNTTYIVVVDVYWDDSTNSNTQTYLYKNLTLPAMSTFEHTDKIILEASDILYFNVISIKNAAGADQSSGETQFVTSYLTQT